MSDIIKQAGGFTQDAERSDVYIVFPNGKSKTYRGWLKNPRVLDGSVIHIGRERETEPFDKTEFVKELTTIFANISQAIAVILIARN